MNKKLLYESIMKDVSKIVKKHLNENVDDRLSGKELCDEIVDHLYNFDGVSADFPTPTMDQLTNPMEYDDEDQWDEKMEAIIDYRHAWAEDLAHYLGFADMDEMFDATGLDDPDWVLLQSFSDNY